jgi:hypothetical protein
VVTAQSQLHGRITSFDLVLDVEGGYARQDHSFAIMFWSRSVCAVGSRSGRFLAQGLEALRGDLDVIRVRRQVAKHEPARLIRGRLAPEAGVRSEPMNGWLAGTAELNTARNGAASCC